MLAPSSPCLGHVPFPLAFVLPLPGSSLWGDRVVMEGPGTQSAEDIFVTGFRDSQALGSQTHSWEREAGGRECRALSQGTLQFPSPCEE